MFVFCQVYDGEGPNMVLFGILTILCSSFMTHKMILHRVEINR